MVVVVFRALQPWRESDMSSSRYPPLKDLRAFNVARKELQYTGKYINKGSLSPAQDVRRPMLK